MGMLKYLNTKDGKETLIFKAGHQAVVGYDEDL